MTNSSAEKTKIQLLVVDDSELDAMLLEEQLLSGGYELDSRRVDNAEDMAVALVEKKWDLVVSDHNMPRFSSFAALEMVRARFQHLPFIVVSGSVDEDARKASIRAGAQDSIEKGDGMGLLSAVRRELAASKENSS